MRAQNSCTSTRFSANEQNVHDEEHLCMCIARNKRLRRMRAENIRNGRILRLASERKPRSMSNAKSNKFFPLTAHAETAPRSYQRATAHRQQVRFTCLVFALKETRIVEQRNALLNIRSKEVESLVASASKSIEANAGCAKR